MYRNSSNLRVPKCKGKSKGILKTNFEINNHPVDNSLSTSLSLSIYIYIYIFVSLLFFSVLLLHSTPPNLHGSAPLLPRVHTIPPPPLHAHCLRAVAEPRLVCFESCPHLTEILTPPLDRNLFACLKNE